MIGGGEGRRPLDPERRKRPSGARMARREPDCCPAGWDREGGGESTGPE